MTKGIHKKDDEAVSLPGVAASSLVRRSGQPVIISFQARNAAASMALEEARSLDGDVPPTIGDLAVRIVGRFKLPRVKVLGPPQGGGKGDPSA